MIPVSKPADAITAFAQAFFEGAGPALTTLLSRSVAVGSSTVEALKSTEILARFPLPWLLARCPYARGMTGDHWVIVALAQASALARVMVDDQGEPPPDELPLAYEDALREAIGQVLAGSAATLMPVLARSVAFATPVVSVITDANDLPQELAPQASAWLWIVHGRATAPDGLTVDLAVTVAQDLAREITAIRGAESVAQPAALPPLVADSALHSRLDLIMDISLPLSVELGRARMQIQDLLKLAPGSVIELDKLAGDPVELFINDRPIAKGEVVVIDENFGVRLTSIVAPSERIKSLR